MPRGAAGAFGLPLSDHYKLGMMIKETAEKLGRRTVIIASGDLSHVLKEDGPYGFHEEGPIYDKRLWRPWAVAILARFWSLTPIFAKKVSGMRTPRFCDYGRKLRPYGGFGAPSLMKVHSA